MTDQPSSKVPGGWFRQVSPLVLLGLGFVFLFEPWFERNLPGHETMRSWLGEHFVLRVACAAVVFYLLVLFGECVRLHSSLTSVLKALREALTQRAAGAEAAGGDAARYEAMRVLAAALQSGDAAVRQKSRANLARLAGVDLGEDPAAWRRWLDERCGSGS